MIASLKLNSVTISVYPPPGEVLPLTTQTFLIPKCMTGQDLRETNGIKPNLSYVDGSIFPK